MKSGLLDGLYILNGCISAYVLAITSLLSSPPSSTSPNHRPLPRPLPPHYRRLAHIIHTLPHSLITLSIDDRVCPLPSAARLVHLASPNLL